MPSKTISLIGMPGAGKSSIGVILAKRCGLRFVDTDLDLQVRAGATLQEILERDGFRRLRQLEHEVLLAIDRSASTRPRPLPTTRARRAPIRLSWWRI